MCNAFSFRTNENKECFENEFTCADGSCIEKELLCNGFRDCPDNEDEDETNCPGEPSSIPTTTEDFGIDEDVYTPTETPTTDYPEIDQTTEYCKLFISCAKSKVFDSKQNIGQHEASSTLGQYSLSFFSPPSQCVFLCICFWILR